MPATVKIGTLAEAIDWFDDTLRSHPERDRFAAEEAVLEGRHRRYPCIGINHLTRPDDEGEAQDDWHLPEVVAGDDPEGKMARRVVGLAGGLTMLNPISPALGASHGPGTFVTCFGIPLNPDAVDTPAFTRTVRELLADDPPDPATAGLIPGMHEEIEQIKAFLPPRFKISMPDFQGPFNLACSMLGEEGLYAAYEDEEGFHELMDRITTFWIAAYKNFQEWIGDDRQQPGWVNKARIAECSVNMVSRGFYEEFLLPYDLRISAAFEKIGIHPCSGPHVFHATLDNIPNVVAHEAGYIAKTAAGSISVDAALEAIGDRPIRVQIGQELPLGEEYDFIRRDLDRCAENPRLMMGYTGMSWGKKDRPMIRDLHRRLDQYWEDNLAHLAE